jgi:serine/threonine protein kinase
MLQPGTRIGRYEIQRRLGRGGMGTVYVAHDPVLGRMVAIKVFLSDLDMADAVERFTREARSSAALNHSNIVTVHDFGEWESQPYIVMEYVQGETLAEIIRRRAPVSPVEKLRLIEELCAGAWYAHQLGVIHRDIKPTNLMVDRSGRLKILDFGIAKMLGTLSTNATGLIGTPGYMAPEQIVGGPIDQRSDLFSIAVVCYELLTYAEAFPGDTVPSITHRIVHEDPRPLAQVLPEATPDLVAVVERGLRKSAADRFADAETFRQAIARVRRDLEGGREWSKAPSRGFAPPPAATNQRGTGSARKHTSDVVAVAELTPPPEPRKTDREAIARRRATQIEAALDLARRSLQQDELERALDACEQALTLDDSHLAALDLEQTIKTAIERKRERALMAEAQAERARVPPTGAQNPQNEGSVIDVVATMLAMPVVDKTILAPVRRTAAPPAPTAREPKPQTRTPAAVPAPAVARKDPFVALRRLALLAHGTIAVLPLRNKLIAAGALAAIAVGVFFAARPAPVVPTGSLMIDAVPWATITAIQATDGTNRPLPSPASTPVLLNVPAGTYQVRLAGPGQSSASRVLTVQVQEGRVTSAPIEQFETLTPEAYFEPYLAAPAATPPVLDVPPAASETPAATPAAPQSPGSMP